MRVQTCVSSSASQFLMVFENDMLACVCLFIPFGETEVYYVKYVLSFADPNQKVIRLDIPMQEALRVHILDSLKL